MTSSLPLIPVSARAQAIAGWKWGKYALPLSRWLLAVQILIVLFSATHGIWPHYYVQAGLDISVMERRLVGCLGNVSLILIVLSLGWTSNSNNVHYRKLLNEVMILHKEPLVAALAPASSAQRSMRFFAGMLAFALWLFLSQVVGVVADYYNLVPHAHLMLYLSSLFPLALFPFLGWKAWAIKRKSRRFEELSDAQKDRVAQVAQMHHLPLDWQLKWHAFEVLQEEKLKAEAQGAQLEKTTPPAASRQARPRL